MFTYARAIVALLLVMIVVRAGLALPSYVASAAMMEAFGMTELRNDAMLYFIRAWAARDAVIALLVLTASRSHLKPLLIGCIAIDVADLASVTALRLSGGFFVGEHYLAQLGAILGALIPEAVALLLILRAGRAS